MRMDWIQRNTKILDKQSLIRKKILSENKLFLIKSRNGRWRIVIKFHRNFWLPLSVEWNAEI